MLLEIALHVHVTDPVYKDSAFVPYTYWKINNYKCINVNSIVHNYALIHIQNIWLLH